jgi:hypothetical protein
VIGAARRWLARARDALTKYARAVRSWAREQPWPAVGRAVALVLAAFIVEILKAPVPLLGKALLAAALAALCLFIDWFARRPRRRTDPRRKDSRRAAGFRRTLAALAFSVVCVVLLVGPGLWLPGLATEDPPPGSSASGAGPTTPGVPRSRDDEQRIGLSTGGDRQTSAPTGRIAGQGSPASPAVAAGPTSSSHSVHVAAVPTPHTAGQSLTLCRSSAHTSAPDAGQAFHQSVRVPYPAGGIVTARSRVRSASPLAVHAVLLVNDQPVKQDDAVTTGDLSLDVDGLSLKPGDAVTLQLSFSLPGEDLVQVTSSDGVERCPPGADAISTQIEVQLLPSAS